MATYYGVNADKLLVDNPPDKATPGEQGGVLRMIRDEFELTADLEGGTDTIRMGGKIPKGARIHDVHLFFDDLDTSGGTMDVGWEAGAGGDEAADVDGFFDGVDVATASDCFKASDQGAALLAKWKGKTFLEEVQPLLSPIGDTDATSGTIILEILYIVD